MKIYLLDTDIAGFSQNRHSAVMRRASKLSADDLIVTTVITFGEDLSGWLPACRRAQDGVARTKAYSRLLRGLEFYCKLPCLPFDEAAAIEFDRLKDLKLRIGTNDLSIAAIALSVGAIVVTRNVKDFQRIPDLIVEDWTV